MRGLYAIVDVTTLERRQLSVLEVVRALVRARPAALQLRAKDLAPREVLHLLRAIHPICREAGVPLFANDRPDLAVLSGCEGVHIGQSDLPLAVVRRIAPGLRIGISTHTLEQVESAIADRPDYVAFGPVFDTRSKPDHEDVVGLDRLRAVAARCPVPVVAIGGIDLDRAHDVAQATRLGAVIGALLPDADEPSDLGTITRRACALHSALASA